MLLNRGVGGLLRVPWTVRKSNQSILKDISPGCSLEGLMLKLKLQLWSPDVKSWLIWKDPDAGKDWWQEEKGTTEDEMVGWHHRLNGHGFQWTPGVGDRQGGLESCGSWGHIVGHNWATELKSSTNKLCFTSEEVIQKDYFLATNRVKKQKMKTFFEQSFDLEIYRKAIYSSVFSKIHAI